MRKLLILLLAVNVSLAADWEAILQVQAGKRIEITTRDGVQARGALWSAAADAAVIRDESGERSFARAEVRRVRVYEPGRRIRRGLLWTAVGRASALLAV